MHVPSDCKWCDAVASTIDGLVHHESTCAANDVVNRPHHYIADNGMECIDVIEAFGLGFRLGNVLKYLLRAERKGGVESLKKAQWYLNREITKREERDPK